MDPIIRSLLDTDFYKFTMGQLVFRAFRDVPVKYAFKLRTKGVDLAQYISMDQLRRELDHTMELHFQDNHIRFLRGTPKNAAGDRMFYEDYLGHLTNLTLPQYKLTDDFTLEFPGSWATAIYWETYALSIISELYYRGLLDRMSTFEREVIFAQGKVRLAEKIRKLRTRPNMTFSDFGTRRRFSRIWQEYVVKTFASELPATQFIGTSNVQMSMDLGLEPKGTFAHELDMGISGVMHGSDDEIRQSHNKVLELWYELYGEGLSVALTDTYGTDFFFRDMTKEQAKLWRGLRQDSADPFVFGQKAIKFYRDFDIDPRTKLVVFSDSLDVDLMISLYDTFTELFKVTHGLGTNATNDLGLSPLSMVVKLVESNGHGTVKLSDNIEKAVGTPEDIIRFKRIFGYNSTYSSTCTY